MARRLTFAASLAAGLSASVCAVAQPAAAESPIHGVWRNPKDSVHVEIRPCTDGACGYVVWANTTAEADARRGGTEHLVGLQLFRRFTQGAGGIWRGKVFVPDFNATFSGTAQLVDPNTLRASGCLLAKFFCKTQDWTRIGGPPA